MNKKSIIFHSDFVYCRLQGLIWETNGLSTPFNFDNNTGKVLAEIYSTIEKNNPMVVNCRGILDNDDHSFSSLFKLIDQSSRPIYFINSKDLKVQFDSQIEEFIQKDINILTPDKKTLIISRKQEYLDAKFIYSNCEKIESKLVNDYIHDCFEKFDDNMNYRLPSTPIVGNGVFNASNIISDPKAFLWLSIKMSDKLNEILSTSESDKINEMKLLSVSLRSSPFAAAVGLLNKMEIEVIDHLGPKYKIFDLEELEAIFWADSFREYLYIGDFAFAGTEIKIAQAFATLTGCKLDTAIVLGNLIPTDSFKDSFKLHSLSCLNGLNKNAKFALFEDEIL